MANPTFDGTALTTDGAQQRSGTPRNRSYTGSLPGVEGEFVQESPLGGRMIVVSGLYKSTGATRAAAISALRTALEAVQAKIGLVKTYVGTASRTYTNCLLVDFTAGRTQVYGLADPFTAICRVQAQLDHTVSTGVS